MIAKEDIPNFYELTRKFEEWMSDPDDDFTIQVMRSMEGYNEWLEWMEENRPDDLP